MKTKAQLEARSDELTADAEDWDNRALGASEQHAQVLRKTSIRLPDDIIKSLKAIAGQKRIPYQTYIRMVLAEHIDSENS